MDGACNLKNALQAGLPQILRYLAGLTGGSNLPNQSKPCDTVIHVMFVISCFILFSSFFCDIRFGCEPS